MGTHDYNFLAEYTGELETLLGSLAEAQAQALSAHQPSSRFFPKALRAVLTVVGGSFRKVWHYKKLALIWTAFCAGLVVVHLVNAGFDKAVVASPAFETRLAELALLYFLAPSAVFGWGALASSIRGLAGDPGVSLFRKAYPTVFVAHDYDPVLGRLQGCHITPSGVQRYNLPAVPGITSEEVPRAYIRLVLPSDEALVLMDVHTGAYYTWFHNSAFLKEHSTQLVQEFAAVSQSRGALTDLLALAELVGLTLQEQQSPSSTVFVPKARIQTGTDSSWDTLVLSPEFKVELQTTCEMLKNAAQLKAQGFAPPTGMLLFGPPGTGKTEIARTLANMSGLSFVTKSTSDLKGQYVGQSAPRIKDLFEEARRCAPSIVFIDEIEVLAARRDAGAGEADSFTRDIVAELLVQMDGVIKHDQDVFVVAATNYPDQLDTALLSRFKRKLEVSLPDAQARRTLLDIFLQGKRCADGVPAYLDGLALKTEGYSGRDLRAICELAAQRAVARAIQDGRVHEVVLTMPDFSLT